MQRHLKIALLLGLLIGLGYPSITFGQIVQMVYTSDAHYGITRKNFKGDTAVNAKIVNAAMIKAINTVPALTLPDDGGIASGKKVTAVDYLIQSGDIANRMEIPYQSAATSWAQFEHDYRYGVTLKDHQHKPAKLLLAPGNHDISNAIGYSKPMNPKTDPTAMVKIYNLMMKPAQPKTNENYNYTTDKVNYSLNIKGIHVIFITLWPDSAERIWMQKDLQKVANTTPVIVFCHDQPTCESKHFTNPVPPYNMTLDNKFENLTAEHYKEGHVAAKNDGATDIEQRGWVAFLRAHPNIKAYFHGNSNWNEFYVYRGPDNDVALNTFRVDSPMKGEYSSKDETKLSFQLISLDAVKQELTVRECLWDTEPTSQLPKVVFGDSKTISLVVKR
ncbi:metallophosphoesterase [Mucilaginibacter sp. dw_454]|uniref:metallophosphoesterase family protein n=1 Tax=Mucilaginibacter sp. dw_454 TaxID=2720079 RepID=UPI001BD46860|nr:metallophosphoesterase [Mucilaginibacter sp. dw_454]